MYRFSNGKMIKLSNSDDDKPCKKVIPIYDENGLLLADKRDICDCPTADCPGCFFPCEKCGSSKCGHMCRVNRSWRYKSWVICGVPSTSNDLKEDTVKIIDIETKDNLVKQKQDNLKPAEQTINDLENIGIKLENRKNTDAKIEDVKKINLKIGEIQNIKIKRVDPVLEITNNLDLNDIENKDVKIVTQQEIKNIDNTEILNDKEKLMVVKQNVDEVIKEEKQQVKIVKENDKKNLEPTDNEIIENVVNNEKQSTEKESTKELKNANIEQTVLLPEFTDNKELKINEFLKEQEIKSKNVKETLKKTEKTENINMNNDKLVESKEFENTITKEQVFHKQEQNLENNEDPEKCVDKLVDSERNQQIKIIKVDIKNNITDLKQIEYENIEENSKKTIFHEKHTNEEYIKNVVTNKLIEIEKIRSENVEKVFKQNINIESTNMEINQLTEQKEFGPTMSTGHVGMDTNKLIEQEKIKNKDVDESMKLKYNENIGEFK